MNPSRSQSPRFATTQWSLVLAVMDTSPAQASEALERLCARYWFPVYAFIRHQGNDEHLSEDLTQGFFHFAIEHKLVEGARKDKGRFRNFILTALKNYLHNHHDHAIAAKRGGGYRIVPLDDANAETFFACEPTPVGTPEDSFDRRWAVTLIRRVMENLRAEFAKRGRDAVHDALLPYLTSEPAAGDYQRIASQLAMENGTLRVALHRFRHRFGELLRSEVAHTVADPAEVGEEIRYLLSVLAGE